MPAWSKLFLLSALFLSTAASPFSANANIQPIRVVTVEHCNSSQCIETVTVYRWDMSSGWTIVSQTTRVYDKRQEP